MRSSLSSPWLKVREPQQKNLKGQHSSMVVRPLLSLKESCGHRIPASQSRLCVPIGKAASLVVNHHHGLMASYTLNVCLEELVIITTCHFPQVLL